MQPNLQQQYHIIGSNLLVYLVYLNLVFFSLILSINCSIVYVSFVSCGLCEYAPFQTHIVITAYGSHFATSPYLKTCVNTFYVFEDVLRLVKEQNEPHYICSKTIGHWKWPWQWVCLHLCLLWSRDRQLDSVCILGSKACMAHMTEDVKQDHDELMAWQQVKLWSAGCNNADL